MGSNSIQQKYYKLAEKVIVNFVFYIPNRALQELDTASKGFEVLHPFINTIYVIDRIKGPVLFVVHDEQAVNNDSYLLNDNKYELLKLRKKLDKLEFDLVFQDYCKQVVFYKFISKWLLEEYLYIETKAQKDFIKSQLLWQHTALSQHFEDLKTISSYNSNTNPISATSNEILQLLDTHLSNYFSKQDVHGSISSPNNITPIKSTPFNSLTRKPTAEKVKIDEHAIERYLLKSQFNVKFSDLN